MQYDRVGLPDSAITPRRGSLPVVPTSPYGRLSPTHSPEPFALRSSGEFRHPRRGDSRLSDNTGLGSRVADEMPPPFRRPGSGFARTQRHVDAFHPRHVSQLDSVEDSIAKDCSEYQDEDSEREDDNEKKEKTVEVESIVDADGDMTPREIDEENNNGDDDDDDTPPPYSTQETPRVSDGSSDHTEEALAMESAIPESADKLCHSDDSEVSPTHA